MTKKFFFWLLVFFVANVSVAQAQQPTKIPQLGALIPTTASFFSSRIAAFRQGLKELGVVEGKDISIEYRYADGKLDRLAALAAELVHQKVDVILTAGEFGVLAAKKATSTIPIVFAVAEDAVESGLVSSLARPGGNVTGMTVLAADLGGKRFELLKESFPKASRVDFLWPSGGPRGNAPFTEMGPQPRRWDLGSNPFRFEASTTLEVASTQRKGKPSKRPSRPRMPSSILSEIASSISPQRTSCQRSTRCPSSRTRVA